MVRGLAYTLTAALAFATLAAAQNPADLPGALREPEAVDAEVFESIARRRDAAAFEELCRAVATTAHPASLVAACRAFRHFRGAGELEVRAIEFLRERALSGRAAARVPAAWGLVAFEGAAHEALDQLLRESDDAACRSVAAGGLVTKYRVLGDERGLVLLARNFAIPESGSQRVAVATFRALEGERGLDVLAARLRDPLAGVEVKLAMLEALGTWRTPGVGDTLAACLRLESPRLRIRAAEELARRDERGQLRALRALERDRDPRVRTAAIESESRVLGRALEWAQRVAELAADRDWALRRGAARAAARLERPSALEVLHELAGDADVDVRLAAFEVLTELRARESVPVLVERLAHEQGAAARELARALRLLTGEDLGATAERWSEWWDAEGAAFRLPEREVALLREEERLARRRANDTQATFFGLEVEDERACFVIDVSNSMNLFDPGYRENRLDRARRELGEVLAGYPDGATFNVLFFSSEVHPWKDGLVTMNARVRQDALAFVAAQLPRGSTSLYDALEAALDDAEVEEVYLLSDGEPSSGEVVQPEAILRRVGGWRRGRRFRIHAVAVGGELDLLEQLAWETGGQFRAVE